VKGGDTFFLEGHLWIILSDPKQNAEEIVLVNLTTWKLIHDPACIVNEGEHSFIKWQTCVNYPRARLETAGSIACLFAAGEATSREPLSAELLQKIRNRAGESQMIRRAYLDLLVSQGLIDLD
jgi:hypothetical protein